MILVFVVIVRPPKHTFEIRIFFRVWAHCELVKNLKKTTILFLERAWNSQHFLHPTYDGEFEKIL